MAVAFRPRRARLEPLSATVRFAHYAPPWLRFILKCRAEMNADEPNRARLGRRATDAERGGRGIGGGHAAGREKQKRRRIIPAALSSLDGIKGLGDVGNQIVGRFKAAA